MMPTGSEESIELTGQIRLPAMCQTDPRKTI